MAGKIIWWAVTFGCAVLFYAIGIRGQKRETPMIFWVETKVDASRISDVARYNEENAVMWKRYSLWYFAAGLAAFWDILAAMVILLLGGSVGIVFLIHSYNSIYKKYKI